jgi:hypothetical protein
LDFARAFSEASKISVPAPAAAPEQQSGARGAAPQGPRAVWQPEGYKIPSEAKSRGQKSPPESAIAVQTPTPTPASPRTPVESGGMRQGAAASSQFEPAGPESSSRGSGTTHEMPAEPQTIPPAFGTAHRVRKDVMRGLKREGRIRRRMEKLGRRLQASSPLKTPLWRRPLPLALLALLVIIFIARVSHHSTSRKTAESKSNHGEVDVRHFAEAEKQQAEKIREQVARELGEQGLKIPPQGTHPEGLPAPGIPEVPSTWGAASTPQAKIFLVPRASAHWQGEVKEGDIVGREFIDGGLKLESASVPPRVLEHAPKGSFVTLQLRVETTGKIYEGRRLAGDATAAKLLIEAAQEGWRFNAPKVNGVPVRTRADIVVHF